MDDAIAWLQFYTRWVARSSHRFDLWKSVIQTNLMWYSKWSWQLILMHCIPIFLNGVETLINTTFIKYMQLCQFLSHFSALCLCFWSRLLFCLNLLLIRLSSDTYCVARLNTGSITHGDSVLVEPSTDDKKVKD